MSRQGDRRIARGWCAIGVQNLRYGVNLGTLWRSAVCLDARYVFTVGRRFTRECSDTVASWRQIPAFSYETVDEWRAALPYDAVPVAVELVDGAQSLADYAHPDRAVYLLGPENGSVSRAALDVCRDVVRIDSRYCLNVAVAGSLVLYDRAAKRARAQAAPARSWIL